MSILVCGGAGYIGSHINKQLNLEGYDTIVFDNLVYGHREAVFHFAAYAYVGESVEEPEKYYYNNVVNTLNLLKVMRSHGCNKIILKCLVIDRRDHIAGNTHSKQLDDAPGIEVHMYGPHIFHTDKEDVWEYVNRFAKFNHFTYCPMANYKGELYNLPFNMNTFHAMWGVNTPYEAEKKLRAQRAEFSDIEPQNLEEQALKLVGRDIYEKLINGYTEKQWGRRKSAS